VLCSTGAAASTGSPVAVNVAKRRATRVEHVTADQLIDIQQPTS
jgi:hypothetical protein